MSGRIEQWNQGKITAIKNGQQRKEKNTSNCHQNIGYTTKKKRLSGWNRYIKQWTKCKCNTLSLKGLYASQSELTSS